MEDGWGGGQVLATKQGRITSTLKGPWTTTCPPGPVTPVRHRPLSLDGPQQTQAHMLLWMHLLQPCTWHRCTGQSHVHCSPQANKHAFTQSPHRPHNHLCLGTVLMSTRPSPQT